MAETEYTIAAVPTTLVEVLWSQMENYLADVVEVAHNEITLDSIKSRLLRGDAMALVICLEEDIIAVNLLEVRVFDSGVRALYIPVVGGEFMTEWADQFLSLAHAIAKDLNCTELRGLAARKGWIKFLANKGWEPVSTALRCSVI